MKPTFRSVSLVFSVLLSAFFVTKFLQSISTDIDEKTLTTHQNDAVFVDDSVDDLLWFIQISDLHISIFQDEKRISELREFCDVAVKTIKPVVVLVTGDITDAKAETSMGSDQYVGEWAAYSDILTKCDVTKTTTWLDIRGNHDNFNVPGVSSPNNLFRKYSIQGPIHKKSYIHFLKSGSMSYSFIGVDSCPDQGMKRPLNFVGYLPPDEITNIQSLNAIAAETSNYTIWFGHYPTSCTVNSGPLRQMIGSRRGSLVYLCGHYHSLLNTVPRMYTIQKEHYLELELKDWKDARMYRVAAVDHGSFSFADIKHGEWPVILVTNPKHARYRLLLKEPQINMNVSYIRILAFSPRGIASVAVQIDSGEWMYTQQHDKKPNFFVLKWNPELYQDGVHIIRVTAIDKSGRQRTINQKFSFDDSQLEFDLLARVILMLNFASFFQFWYVSSCTLCLFFLCVVPVSNYFQYYPARGLLAGFFKNWIRRLWLLSNCGGLYRALLWFPVYLSFGPWAVGEVIDNHFGVIFIWGTYVNNQFIPELSTYGYGFVQLGFLHFPLILVSACTLDQRRWALETTSTVNKVGTFINSCLYTAPFLIILWFQVWMAYPIYSAYGVVSIALGPTRLWAILMTISAGYITNYFPQSKMRYLIQQWKQLEIPR